MLKIDSRGKTVLICFLIAFFYYSISIYYAPNFVYPLTIFLTAATFWFIEILPLHITSLLVPLFAVLTGVLPIKKAIGSFYGEVILLLLGIIVIAYSIQKHHCEKRLVGSLLCSKLVNNSLKRASLLLGCSSFFMSMWISNTATCAMFMTICIGLIHSLEKEFESAEQKQKTTTYLLLLCTYSASVGGLATPIGSPPNLLIIDFLAKHQISIGFLEWMKFGLPLALVMFGVCILTLNFFIKLPNLQISEFKIQSELYEKKITIPQIQAVSVFSLALLFWIVPEFLIASFPELLAKESINTTYVILLFASCLFFLPYKTDKKIKFNLEINDFKFIEWKTILLFGGGICLGTILTESGLTNAIVKLIVSNNLSPQILFIVVTIIAIFISEFVSNTATVSVLSAVVYSIATQINYSATGFLLGLACAASLGFMLPTSTVPNALVFATDKIKLRDMIKIGFFFDFLCWAIATVFLGYYFKIFN